MKRIRMKSILKFNASLESDSTPILSSHWLSPNKSSISVLHFLSKDSLHLLLSPPLSHFLNAPNPDPMYALDRCYI